MIFVLVMGMNFSSKAQDATTILKKVDDITTAANDATQYLTITLTSKSGKTQQRKAVLMQKGDNKRLFKFSEPAAQKGIGFLSLPNDLMYLYMPAYGKERRIASSAKNQKFAGTDMTLDELEAKKYSEEYNAKLLSSSNGLYTLELTPKGKSQFSKIVLKVNSKTYVPTAIDYYNKGGKKIKYSTLNFVKQGKYWYPKEAVVKDLKTNHSTKMVVTSIKFDQGLSDDKFTVRYLKQ